MREALERIAAIHKPTSAPPEKMTEKNCWES